VAGRLARGLQARYPQGMLTVGFPSETAGGETRCALTPQTVALILKLSVRVLVSAGVGRGAGFTDDQYEKAGATLSDDAGVYAGSQIVCRVQVESAGGLTKGQTVIGLADALWGGKNVREVAAAGATLLAMDMIPRTTRAQSMDALSSQANIAGYKAVLLAANVLPRVFPMMTTAAGTITPAKVLVLGAGVAGLQAIATAKRLGALVEAFDVRAAVKEQIESLGARFVSLDIDKQGGAEGSGGYAKQMDEAYYQRQREELAAVIAGCDVVVSTAAIPGRRSPLLITQEAVVGMPAGGVIVDLAAARGGNCALSKPDEVVRSGGVTILAPTNLPAAVPTHASAMYAKNIANLLAHMIKKGEARGLEGDEILSDTAVVREGVVHHPGVKKAMETAG
jgi:NAD(P) transhydrogenase subunit alpha